MLNSLTESVTEENDSFGHDMLTKTSDIFSDVTGKLILLVIRAGHPMIVSGIKLQYTITCKDLETHLKMCTCLDLA